MRLPRCARNDTIMLNLTRLLVIAHNDNGIFNIVEFFSDNHNEINHVIPEQTHLIKYNLI